MKKIAVITTIRNDEMFLEKWIQYYGSTIGEKNVYVFIDGHDQPLPEVARGINTLYLPHMPAKRAPADRRRAQVMSFLARGLFKYYDAVIVTDVDEFLVVDPKLGVSLSEYLSKSKASSSLSGLGLDVGQHIKLERALDLSRPFLDQRAFAHVSYRYTKPSVSFSAVTWGSGMHRIKGKNFHIDPNLFLFHFGMVDFELSTGKTADADRISTGWSNHLSRRERLFKIITESEAIDGDDYFPRARKYQTWHRQIYAWNKPAKIPNDPVVKIPKRFAGII